MPRLKILCIVIGMVLFAWAIPARAQVASSATAIDVSLKPIGELGTIELVAYILHANLSCNDSGCGMEVEQLYQIHNRGQEATLQLGLPTAEGLPSYDLRIEGGQALAPGEPSADYVATWTIRLGPGEQKRLILASKHLPQQGRLVSWRCETSHLAPWGTVQGARMEYQFPQPVTDDAFLVAEPGNLGIGEGGLVYWDYEVLQNPQDMEVIALSPTTWQQFQELRRGQKHGDLALLYETLYKEALEKGLPMADPYDRVVAEWLAVLQSRPNDQDARRNLARLYRARADAMPSLKLNYLLLTAEQLEALLHHRTGDADIADELVRIYEEASQIASDNNDPAGALNYLRQASTVPGAAPFTGQETLALRLALNLAHEGQVAEALQQVNDILAPDLRETLWRYMPPFYSARAEVITGPQERVVRYQMFLYPPATERVYARMQEIALALRPIEGCQVSWQPQVAAPNEASGVVPVTTTLTVSLSSPSLATLEERSAAVAESLALDPDLISALVAAPWCCAPTSCGTEQDLWQHRLSYQEETSLTSLQSVWEEEADYVRWRLVELRNALPGDERARLEQQLALLVLEQQSQIWELIPSGSYIVYKADYPAFPTYQPSWLVSWGQERTLQASHTFYRWNRILAAVGGVVLLFMLILSRAIRRL